MSKFVPEGVQPRSVTQTANAVRLRLEEHFPEVWVEGEVIDFKIWNGHWYFNLKDAFTQLNCFFHSSFALRSKFDIHDGMQVTLRGAIGFQQQKGYIQVRVGAMEPKGLGAEELAFRQLKERLSAKGYFDPKRKKKVTKYPGCIAIVTSATGAAIRDMLELFSQRWPQAALLVYPCKVQGDGAADQIASGIAALNFVGKSWLDAIIIGRGGGSSKDLSAFNQEIVADAIVKSKVPVVSAVGHEVDLSLTDLVADVRAETPTAAVVAITPDRQALMRQMKKIEGLMTESSRRRLYHARRHLTQLVNRPAIRNPLARFRQADANVKQLARRCRDATMRKLENSRDRLKSLAARLDSLSPLAVLGRGYSLTKRGDGSLVREHTDVVTGEIIRTQLSNGSIVSKVIQTDAGANG